MLGLSSVSGGAHTTSNFVRNVAFSSDLEDLSGAEADEPSYSPDAKLFVGNLPFNVDSGMLAGLFEQAGSVEQVEVIYDKATGRSRGFGFVVMSSVEDAEAAAEQFNGYEIEGRALRVNSGPPPPKRETSSFGGSRGGRERSYDNNSSFGGSRGRERSYDNNSSFGGSRGRERSYDNNSSFGGGSRGGQDRSSYGNTNKIYVGNLAWEVDNVALETLFSEHGNVQEARVVYDRENGRSRGFGFVTYSSTDEVNKACERLDGTELGGRPLRVNPAEDRR